MGGVPFSSKYHCSASTFHSIVFTVSCFLFLAHFIHINGDYPNISDLKVRVMRRGGGTLSSTWRPRVFTLRKTWIFGH